MDPNQLGVGETEGPYKATTLWREAVRGFREGMVLQRHWRNLRYHERCFTGAAAVTWLHRYLSGHALFSADVSRQQTVRLLAKFLQAGIVQEVRGRRGGGGAPEFRDDSRLYRLSTHGTPGRSALALMNGNAPEARQSAAEESGCSPQLRRQPQQQQQPSRCSPAPEQRPPEEPQQPLPQCRPVMRPPTAAEVDAAWSHALLARLEAILEAPAVDIVAGGCVVPAWIRHNVERVTQSGLVQPLPGVPPSLPRWLILAMKTLASWPQAQLADLPEGDYADFQLDVFRVIREFFAALPFPLVPHELYESLVAALLRAEHRDRQLRQPPPPPEELRQRRRQSTAPAGSVENLLLLMSPRSAATTPRPPADTPLLGSGAADGRYRNFKEDSLFVSPAPVTPARQSVARLRGRLMRLGVGGTSGAGLPTGSADTTDDVFATDEEPRRQSPVASFVPADSADTTDDVFAADGEPRRRPRAASFLRAIAGGKENSPPPEPGTAQFCQAVFRPPVEAGRSGGRLSDSDGSRTAPAPGCRLPAAPTLSTVSLPVAGFFPSTSSLQPARYVPTASLQPNALGPPPSRPFAGGQAVSPDSVQGPSAESSPAALSLLSAEYYLTSSRLQSPGPTPADASLQSAGRLHTGRQPRRSAGSVHSLASLASVSSGARLSLSGASQSSPAAADSSRGSAADSAVGSSLASERPADTCLETVFGAAGPVTRLIPQRSVEALHLPSSRPGSRLSEAAAGSTESVSSRGRAPGAGPAAIRRHQLRDDSLSRSLRRLKERRRDKQEQRRRREQQPPPPPPPSSAADYAEFSSGLSRTDGEGARPAAPSALKAARLLGVAVEQVEEAQPPPPPVPARAAPWRGPAAQRVWQRRSVADPSRVSQPLSPLQQAARQRLSVVGRDYENIRDLGRLTAEPPALPVPPPKPARAPHLSRFRATPSKRGPLRGLDSTTATGTPHDLETPEGHKLARESLQLLLTLLPPGCRRQLQLLLRFMYKAATNQRLQLAQHTTGRELMVNTFADRILRPACEDQADRQLERRLVGYLLDHQAEILAPAEHIRDAVTDRLQRTRRETVQYGDEPGRLAFCQRVSAEQYDQERRSTSGSLLSLLDTIITDTRMTKKDKVKRLRQFREVYPDVYALRLAEADQHLAAADTRRTRSLFATGSLTSLVRSKSLRI